MKSYLKNLSVLFFAVCGLTSCDLFDKVDDVKFEGKLPVTFEINEGNVSEIPVTYSETEILNALDNDEIAKYKDKIKEIKLNKITYKIENYDAPAEVIFSNGSLQISSGKTLATITSLTLQNTAEAEFVADPLSFADFAAEIKDDKQVAINMQGTLSTTPVAFTLTAYFHVTVTAEVLK